MPKSSSTRGQKMVGIDTTLVRPKIKPPNDLTPEAKKVWVKLVNSVPNEQFTESDYPVLATYCEVYATMRNALNMLLIEGYVLEDRWGKPFKNPWAAIANECAGKIPTLAMKLRLSPSSRKKAEVTHEKTPSSTATSTLGNLIKR